MTAVFVDLAAFAASGLMAIGLVRLWLLSRRRLRGRPGLLGGQFGVMALVPAALAGSFAKGLGARTWVAICCSGIIIVSLSLAAMLDFHAELAQLRRSQPRGQQR